MFTCRRSGLGVENDDPGISYIGPDGNIYTAVVVFRVPEGTSKTIRLDFSLPRSERRLEVIPSARLRPITYRVNGAAFNDAVPMKLDLQQLAPDSGPAPLWLVIGLLLFGLGAGFLGDGWGRTAIAGDGIAARRAKIDANLGWWLLVFGLAMLAVQVAIYITAP